jgi:mannose-6-phosphate isomerase-like protein (cupin superfamily)
MLGKHTPLTESCLPAACLEGKEKAKARMKKIHRDNVEPFVTKDKAEIRELNHSKKMSLAEAIVKMGQTTELHYHVRSEEIYYILEGKGLMEIEGEKQEVSRDHAILIPPKKRHRITANGNAPLRFLCFCSPPYSDEDTVLVGSKESLN